MEISIPIAFLCIYSKSLRTIAPQLSMTKGDNNFKVNSNPTRWAIRILRVLDLLPPNLSFSPRDLKKNVTNPIEY